jgi:hypothetical protein
MFCTASLPLLTGDQSRADSTSGEHYVSAELRQSTAIHKMGSTRWFFVYAKLSTCKPNNQMTPIVYLFAPSLSCCHLLRAMIALADMLPVGAKFALTRPVITAAACMCNRTRQHRCSDTCIWGVLQEEGIACYGAAQTAAAATDAPAVIPTSSILTNHCIHATCSMTRHLLVAFLF